MAAQPTVTNKAQQSFEETVLTEQEAIDAIDAWVDADKELRRLSDLRDQIRDLEKQKRDAKELLGELLDLTKAGIYRVGTCVITVSLPEEESITVERVNRPRIRIKDEVPE